MIPWANLTFSIFVLWLSQSRYLHFSPSRWLGIIVWLLLGKHPDNPTTQPEVLWPLPELFNSCLFHSSSGWPVCLVTPVPSPTSFLSSWAQSWAVFAILPAGSCSHGMCSAQSNTDAGQTWVYFLWARFSHLPPNPPHPLSSLIWLLTGDLVEHFGAPGSCWLISGVSRLFL